MLGHLTEAIPLAVPILLKHFYLELNTKGQLLIRIESFYPEELELGVEYFGGVIAKNEIYSVSVWFRVSI